jgi:hypothetical protein
MQYAPELARRALLKKNEYSHHLVSDLRRLHSPEAWGNSIFCRIAVPSTSSQGDLPHLNEGGIDIFSHWSRAACASR